MLKIYYVTILKLIKSHLNCSRSVSIYIEPPLAAALHSTVTMPPSMLSIWCSYSYPSVNCSFLFFLNPQNWLGWFGLNFLLNTKPNQLCMPLKRLRVKHPIFVNFKKIDRFIFSTEFHEPKPPFKEWKKNVSRRNLYAHNQKSIKKKKRRNLYLSY